MTVSAAELFLQSLTRLGVDYFFANSGTDFPPIIEAFARGARAGVKLPKPLAVPHENIAVGMAHGYYAVTGKPQVVMVHVNVGTANTINCLINAARDNVPLILCAGRTPVTETGRLGSRSRYIHWAQEMFDQAAMVRETVKWDYELRFPEQAAEVAARAYEVAMSAPRGPVYLTLPRETLAIEINPPASTPAAKAVPAAPHPDPAAIRQLADWIDAARFPLLLTSAVGRDPAAVPRLARLAQRAAIAVVEPYARYCALPASHGMHLGYDQSGLVREADLIISVDCDVPWIPSIEAPRDECRIVTIATDPSFQRYPLHGHRYHLGITSDSTAALAALEYALDRTPRPPEIGARRERIVARGRALRERWEHDAQPGERITMAYASRCLAEFVDDQSIVINEYPLRREQCPIETPGSYFGLSPAGGLGWGFGAALGAKLAAPDKLVIAALGDGAYVFANPTAGHWTAQMHGLPILTVIFNNAIWNAVRRATLGMYPNGAAAESDGRLLADLTPSPAFERIVEAHGGYGERVERPADLPGAIQRAIARVRAGQQAVLNVICI